MSEESSLKLKKLNDENEAFAYIVSHDLKAPARAISNLAGWIEEDLAGNLSGDTEENLRLLKNRSQRLAKMIDALLEYSRVTRNQLEIGKVDLKARIEEILQDLAKDNKVQYSVSGDNVVLTTYEKKLNYVLSQLLENAVYFNDKQVTDIKVTIRKQENHFIISITDNGPGIPDCALDKIFTIFYTVQNKDKADTTGAGLAIANKIVNFVNGKITACNHPEGGLQVVLTWPATITTEDI